jgi:glycosyltransferase involved in cell wall biosynthesis
MQKDIAASALYVAPRFHEGIGLSFLEAMAMGRCVIAVNNPTMNEYIIDGENGFLYDISSPAPIALSPEKIRNIQQNTIKYMQDGRNRWEKDKSLILDWLEQKPSANKKLLKRKFRDENLSALRGSVVLFYCY